MEQQAVQSAASGPRLAVSFAVPDEEWAKWSISRAERLGGWSRVDVVPVPEAPSADAVVVLLSPAYLEVEGARSVLAQLQSMRASGVPVLALLLRPCEWREVRELQELPVYPPEGPTLIERRRGEQDEAWAWIASTLREAERVAAARALAHVDSDSPKGDDHLNIMPDVRALAALAAAWDVEPPLSIGLFGDWGSGKSFFMGKMKEEVARLAAAAARDDRPQRELGYYKSIVQVDFNAWHYVEGNLWAGLVDQVFQALFVHAEGDEDERRRKALLRDLEIKRELKRKVTERQRALEGEKAGARKRLKHAQRKREKLTRKRNKLLAKDAIQIAIDVATLALESRDVGGVNVKLPDRDLPDVGQRTVSADEARRALDDAERRQRLARNSAGLLHPLAEQRSRAYVRFGSTGVVTTAVATGTAAVAGQVPLVQSPLVQIALVGGAGVGMFLWRILPLVREAAASLDRLAQSREQVDGRVSRAEESRRLAVAALEGDLERLTREVRAAEQEVAELDRQIREIERDLNPDPERLLAEFVRDRANADDYKRHLGVPALIRRDFKRLSDLVEKVRQKEATPPPPPAPGESAAPASRYPPLRIVLYIDDLDRCPPERVVDVLQAIHLLLAFPLFVVVVGVDARWVSRALSERYDWLVLDDDAPTSRRRGPAARDGGATPRDYLEKIFQLPFWLEPMSETATADFIAKVARRAPSRGAPGAGSGAGGASEGGGAGGASAARGASAAVDLTPERLVLKDHEVRAMQDLAALVGRSPRAVKRFMNSYRLLRIQVDPAEARTFLPREEGGADGYRHALLLLAIVCGAPDVADALLLELSKRRATGTLGEWLDRLALSTRAHRSASWPLARKAVEAHLGGPLVDASALDALVPFVDDASRFSFGRAYAAATAPRVSLTPGTPGGDEHGRRPAPRA